MSDHTYIICPDAACRQYFDLSRSCPCEHDCPKEAAMKKVVICPQCSNVIVLAGDHFSWCLVECSRCGVINWHRMSGNYMLVYDINQINAVKRKGSRGDKK